MDKSLDVYISTPFITSWFSRVRQGDLRDFDLSRRSGAWAGWFIKNMQEFHTANNRPYIGLNLPGQYFDPEGKLAKYTPNVEIPEHIFNYVSQMFPERLSYAGNGLLFPWWVIDEVNAVKRMLFSVPKTNPSELYDLLSQSANGLSKTAIKANEQLGEIFDQIENLIKTHPDQISELLTGDFEENEIMAYWPNAKGVITRIEFDRILREKSKTRAYSRMGVWRIVNENNIDAVSVLGVITPRLSRKTYFDDPLFDPDKESPAVNLIRGLLCTRILKFLKTDQAQLQVVNVGSVSRHTGFRVIVAQTGQKTPQPHPKAALGLIQAFPDAESAWEALCTWAQTSGSIPGNKRVILAVNKESFLAGWHNVTTSLANKKIPRQKDVNIVLPLGYDEKERVVRVTHAYGG